MMDTISSVLEMLMVICFGISWPLNIVKAWKARTARSTSLPFYLMIWTGYIFGIIGKFVQIAYKAPQPWYMTVKWYVLFFYFLNAVMVSAGILIYFRNRALDGRAESKDR